MPTYFSTTHPLTSLAGVIRSVFTQPTAFFRQMPAAVSYGDSTILLLIVLVAPLMLGVLLSGELIPHISKLLLLVITLPFALVSAWLWAWYLSWAVRRISPSMLSTRDAFQLYTYSNVPSLFGWIPGLGVVTGLWSLYLQWKGLTTYAGVSGGKAFLILIVPLCTLIASAMLLFMLVGIYLSQQSPQPNPVMMF